MSSGTIGFSDKQSQDPGAYPYNGKILLAAVISLSVVLLFVLLLHVYARWFLRRRPMTLHAVREPLHRWSFATFPGHTMEVSLPGDGLDPRAVASLPMFVYKSAEHENELDCVVCLSVMEEDEEGRILPECKHAFHVGCIDVWLMAHSTCPVCRAPVRVDETTSVEVGDAASVVISMAAAEEVVQDEQRSMDGELVAEGGALETGVVAEVPGNAFPIGQSCKNGEPSPSSSSSPTTNYLGCSLKRMLSRSRSENRAFPSALVTQNML